MVSHWLCDLRLLLELVLGLFAEESCVSKSGYGDGVYGVEFEAVLRAVEQLRFPAFFRFGLEEPEADVFLGS